MNLKDELLKLKNQITKQKTETVIETEKVPTSKEKKVTNYSIDKKVDDFMQWYDKNFVKGHYTDIGEYSVPRDMLNIIEKMAVWYELRYPDYEVCERYPGSSHDNLSTDNIYIRKNQAIKDIEDVLDTDKEMFNMAVEDLKWEDILSPKAFINALPWDEKWFLSRPSELKERFLDIVMYRIIERGGTRIGSRRAFMFALDFNRNIDIPMTYGVDYSDPGLRGFIHEYIRAGGHTDLECLVEHGSRKSEKEPLNTVTVGDMIKTVWPNAVDRYTEEEASLHQRLVNALSNGLPVEDSSQVESLDDKQKVEQKRLSRKL